MSKCAVFLHSHQYDRTYQAVNILLGASSMGKKCYLFLFYGALATYIEGVWDETGSLDRPDSPEWQKRLKNGFDMSDTPSLHSLLDRTKDEPGGLTICACSASTRILGLEPSDVTRKVDQIVGLTTMLDLSKDAQVFYI